MKTRIHAAPVVKGLNTHWITSDGDLIMDLMFHGDNLSESW